MFNKIILVLFLFSINLIAAEPEADSTKAGTDPSFDPEIESTIDNMSLYQKVGQLFLIGFNGLDISDGISQVIKQVRPGGLILFGRNIKTARQTAKLIYQSQITAKDNETIPMFIAVDQEGGAVSRIKLNPPIPSAMTIGSNGDTEVTERMGYYTGILLRSLGFNMNLAPVVDLVNDSQPTFIGNRAFHTDPNAAIEMSRSFATGLKLSGIVPTFKHFPGHGASFTDSHLAMPQRMESLDELLKKDLVPFSDLKQQFLPEAIMVAHIAFPNIDPTRVPATFSKIFLQDILRQKLSFNGIIITDDIEMKGAGVKEPLRDRALRSIEAGADMIMIAWNQAAQKACYDGIVDAVNSGRLEEDRINQSVRRILIAKKKLGILREPKPAKLREFRSLMISQSISDLSHQILSNVFENTSKDFKVQPEFTTRGPLMVFSSRRAFHRAFKGSFAAPSQHFGLGDIRAGMIQTSLLRHKDSFALVHITSNQITRALSHVLPGLRKRIFLINGDSPGVIDNARAYKYIFNVYSPDPRVGGMAGELFFQKLKPRSVPMRLPSSKN